MAKVNRTATIDRQTLFESETIRLGSFEAKPTSDTPGEIEYQSLHAIVLPFVGVFAKHEAPGRHVIGTPSHAVFVAANTPYRISFPGAVGDRAIVLRFDDFAVSESIELWNGKPPGTHGLLTADAMLCRDVLRRRLANPVSTNFEIEALALELLVFSVRALHSAPRPVRPDVLRRRWRAVERVKEAVAVAPGEMWSITKLAAIANLSPFHLCHIFRDMVGTSLFNYVQQERLSQTLNAVIEGSEDITAIAIDAGFASHSHFTARFRRFFGCTPSSLRRRANPATLTEIRKIVTARSSRRS